MQFDPDRLTNLGPACDKYLIRAWSSVELVLIVGDGSLPAELAFLFPPGDLWSAGAIQKNWIAQMNQRALRSAEAASAQNAHADKIDEWVRYTQAAFAADVRVVYGDRLANLLESTASEMRQALDWLAARIENPPAHPKAVADAFLTVTLWAWDQYRAALELDRRADGIPGLEAGRTTLLAPAILSLADAGLDFVKTDKALTMRIRALRIRPGEEDNLMADVLSALRSGPYDYNGQEISSR